MDPQSISIATVVRSELINLDGVSKFTPNRRFATVYSEGSPLDSLFFLESGLVKIHKRGDDNKEIILQIVAAGELFGEQALGTEASRSIAAEVLQEGVIYVIPRDLFLRVCDQHPELWREISGLLTLASASWRRKSNCSVCVMWSIAFSTTWLTWPECSAPGRMEPSIPSRSRKASWPA